jgi:hypothetical protein
MEENEEVEYLWKSRKHRPKVIRIWGLRQI